MGKLLALSTVLLSLSAAVADPVSSEGYDLKDLTDTIGSQHSISASLSPYFGAFDNDVTSGGVRLEDYTWRAEFRLSEDVVAALGEETLTDVPVLVRLSSDLPNFSLDSFSDSARRDLLFLDEAGTVLAHEIDSVDSEGGLLVWVKVPELTASTVLTCCYGGPVNPQALNAADTWSGYVGVWHLNAHDASGTTPDATGHGLDATGADFTGIAGPFGSPAAQTTKAMTAPDFEEVHQVGGTFSCSLWFRKPTQAGEYTTFVSKKTGLAWNAATGWYLEMSQSATVAKFISSGSTALSATVPDVRTNWTHFHVVCNGSTVNIYVNGDTTPVLSTSTTVQANSVAFSLLGVSQHGEEFRLKKTADSPLRASIEYKAMADVRFLSTEGFVPVDDTATVFGTLSASVSGDGSVLVTVPVEGGSGDVSVIYNETTEVALGSVATPPCTFTDTPAVPADTIWSFTAKGVNQKGTVVEKACESGVLNGVVNATVTRNADERDFVEGVFTISRPSNGEACTYPLSVNLSWGGTAEAGKNYEDTLPSSVMIPAGAASVTVTVVPMFDSESTEDETLVLTVAPGPYRVGTPAEMTILNLSTPTGFNTWVAKDAGKASDAANWSDGVPQAGQNILFDGRFSTKDCTWDGGVNGLTDSVASWKQCSDYTGTVTFKTTYEEASSTFVRMAIIGNVELLGGKWTHPSNETDVATYHLDVAVGGDLTLAKGTAIDCRYRGFGAKKTYAGGAIGAHGGSSSDWAHARDSVYFPKEIGSSGNADKVYAGGGAVWLSVGGAMTMDGDIDVHSAENTGGWGGPGSGAPGSVYLSAKSLSGTGMIHAEAPVVDRRGAVTASGGRVAIYLTEATELGITLDQIPHYGAISGHCAGAGTVFVKVKGDTYGTLYIVNTKKAMSHTCGLNYHHLTATTPIVAGETWTFDKVVLGKEGSLCVPEGTTLVLPNGFKSVEGDGRLCGILYAGGTIACGDDEAVHTIENNWTFHANKPFTFDRDVVVKDGAAIGQLRFYNNMTTLSQCNVKVQGKLTVESTGYLWAHMTSMVNAGNFESDFVSRPAGTYCHAGLVGVYALDVAGNDFGLAKATYGSIFAPGLGGTHGVGNDGAMQAQGGGLLILDVADELKLDGLCDATGGTYYEETGAAKGSGGSINITAKKLTGVGSITANGAENMTASEENLLAKFFPRTSNSTRGLITCTGGGRIAVKLTGAGETFSDHWREHITAHGWSTGVVSGKPGGAISKYAMSSAGTIYLETKSDGVKGGEIIVRNDGNPDNDLTVTPIPAQTLGDDADSFKCKAGLTLTDCGRVMLTDNLARMGCLTMAEGSVIDLNGKRLVVSSAKLGATRLRPGTYRASDTVVAGFIADSKGTDGMLVVTGGGFAVIIR